jgi:SAM-dependent methyltransferase
MSIARWLDHPLTRGLDLDDPRTTELRRRIVRDKPFLRRIYEEWYVHIAATLPPGPGPVVELGSGAGFLADFIPGLITSEILRVPGIDLVLDAVSLPFEGQSLRAVAMTNVLHHVARPRRVLEEIARCVRRGGVVSMIEPWVSPWSRVIYRQLHHEPFFPEKPEWESTASGPLHGANSALPWILFHRDRERFENELPQWSIRSVEPLMPFRYLVSGGVSRRSLVPGWSFSLWRALEASLAPWRDQLAMFAAVVLERR